MPVMRFGEYRPDVSDLDASVSASILNVVPRGDGYGPMPALSSLFSSLAAQCRGYFFARKPSDGSVVIFAGTATKLYQLNNTALTWTDVSKSGGSYTSLNADANWTFCQFNNIVIACQANSAPQKFDITTDSAFTDVSGSPPNSAYCTTVNRFVVLSGLASYPSRIQWSGLNDITNWTAGTGSSDYQDLPDGGATRGVVGGELGLILQDTALRTMTFSPGSDVIFNIFKVGKDFGVMCPYATVQVNNRIFILSAQGFVMTDTSGIPNFIGQERVDRTFLANYDSQNPQMVIGAADPKSSVVYWIYRSAGNSSNYCDKGLAYNWLLNRWSPFSCSLEFIAALAKPGLTLEALDALAPGAVTVSGAASNGSGLIRLTVGSTTGMTTGDTKTISGVAGTTEANGTWVITVVNSTHIDLQGSTFTNNYVSGGVVGGSLDAMTISLDALTGYAMSTLSGVDSTHTGGFFNGSNLEATLETPEQSGDGQRLLIKGFWPMTDAPTVYGSIGYRENLNAARAYTGDAAMNTYGFVGTMRSTRYARGKLRIPAGTSWSFASGIRPEAQADGYA